MKREAGNGTGPVWNRRGSVSSAVKDHEDDIDWENIIATTEAGRYAFNSADYAVHEEAMRALRVCSHAIQTYRTS